MRRVHGHAARRVAPGPRGTRRPRRRGAPARARRQRQAEGDRRVARVRRRTDHLVRQSVETGTETALVRPDVRQAHREAGEPGRPSGEGAARRRIAFRAHGALERRARSDAAAPSRGSRRVHRLLHVRARRPEPSRSEADREAARGSRRARDAPRDGSRPGDLRAPGPLRLRTFVPDQVDAVFLHIHGGGFVTGSPEMTDLLHEILSKELNLAFVSVDYRLAPEHPYPAGPDDCEAAALWLLEHAEREFGSPRLLIGGESAGAHLAACTLLRLRDRDAVDRFCGANLVFGIY